MQAFLSSSLCISCATPESLQSIVCAANAAHIWVCPKTIFACGAVFGAVSLISYIESRLKLGIAHFRRLVTMNDCFINYILVTHNRKNVEFERCYSAVTFTPSFYSTFVCSLRKALHFETYWLVFKVTYGYILVTYATNFAVYIWACCCIEQVSISPTCCTMPMQQGFS